MPTYNVEGYAEEGPLRWALVQWGNWPRRWRCALPWNEHDWLVSSDEPDRGDVRECQYCRRGEAMIPSSFTITIGSTMHLSSGTSVDAAESKQMEVRADG